MNVLKQWVPIVPNSFQRRSQVECTAVVQTRYDRSMDHCIHICFFHSRKGHQPALHDSHYLQLQGEKLFTEGTRVPWSDTLIFQGECNLFHNKLWPESALLMTASAVLPWFSFSLFTHIQPLTEHTMAWHLIAKSDHQPDGLITK